MPTFMAFRNGEKIGEVVGANPQGLNVSVRPVTMHIILISVFLKATNDQVFLSVLRIHHLVVVSLPFVYTATREWRSVLNLEI
jgi:hypothetical protein